MKRNTKFIAILLTVALVFLVGCSNNIEDKKEAIQPKNEPTGLIEMNIDSAYLHDASYICSKDDLIVFMTNVLKDENGNIVVPNDESDYEKYDSTRYIIKYNAKENKLIDKYEIKDCPIKEIWGIELDNDKIVIFSNSEKKNAYYDLDMNFVDVTDRTVIDESEIAKKSDHYTDMSAIYDGYCYLNGNSDYQYLYFYDNLDEIYAMKTDGDYEPKSYNKENDCVIWENFDDSSEGINYQIIDYTNEKETNSCSINAKDYGYDYISTSQYGLGNKYAVCIEYFGKNDSEKFESKMFLWNYQNSKTNKDIRIEKYTNLDLINTKKIDNIKEKYSIDIRINEVNEYIEDSIKCDKEPEDIILFEDLNVIEDFLTSLPNGMVKEIYSDFSNSENNKSGIRLDLVSEITFEAGAFAKSFVDPMELCFPLSNVTPTNVAHEFMHLFDERISDYDSSCFEKWDEFNKGYEREYNENEETHPEYNFDEKHFLSEYSCTNNSEERAEIFAYLYTGGGDALENEDIRQKADYLIQIINNSFPSVQNSNSVCWKI